jgi:transposase
MARALSLDLRRRVVEGVAEGMSCRQAATRVRNKRLECDPLGGADSLRRRARADEARWGYRRSQRIEAEAAFILGAVARQPDLTLAELKAKLRERGMSVGIGTLWLFFQRHRITLKKRLRMPPSSCART